MYLGPTQPASRTPANNVPPPLIESITYGDSYQESRFAIEQTKPNGCKYTYSAHFNSGHFVVSVRNLIIPCPAFHHMASDRAALPIRPPHSLVLSPGNHHWATRLRNVQIRGTKYSLEPKARSQTHKLGHKCNEKQGCPPAVPPSQSCCRGASPSSAALSFHS